MFSFPKNIVCETSTIADGNMSFNGASKKEIIDNRTHFLGKYGIGGQEHVAMRCNHGSKITLVDHNHAGVGIFEPNDQIQSEVLVTQKKHLALFLLTADCQPMSLYDPITQTIALAHISRKTLVQELVQKTVGFLHDALGADPQNILVQIGPSIKKESYAFELPLQEESEVLKNYTEIKNDFAYIDLESASVAQLIATGIQKEHISISEIDTGTSVHHFSYYRMKKKGEPDTARMATILMQR